MLNLSYCSQAKFHVIYFVLYCLFQGDLHAETFFTKYAETVSTLMSGSDYLRNVDNDYAIDEVTENVHDLSQVFTGAFYDIMVDIFEDKMDLSMYNPAVTLYQTGEHMMEVLLRCVLDQPKDEPDLIDFANGLMAAEQNEKYKEIMKKHFDRRKLFDPSAKPKPVVPAGEKSATEKERKVKCGNQDNVEKVLATEKKEWSIQHIIVGMHIRNEWLQYCTRGK